jgi:hypothetical protein
MNATTVAVDLAKSVFQFAVADDNWKVVENHRLTRTQFERTVRPLTVHDAMRPEEETRPLLPRTERQFARRRYGR